MTNQTPLETGGENGDAQPTLLLAHANSALLTRGCATFAGASARHWLLRLPELVAYAPLCYVGGV
jgi:hypothetical protein